MSPKTKGRSSRRNLGRLRYVDAADEPGAAEQQGHDRQPAVQRAPGVLEALGDLEHQVQGVLAAAHALGDVGSHPHAGEQRLDQVAGAQVDAIGHRTTDDDFVFSDDAGEPLWGQHVTTREFQPLLRETELPPIRFHDLRHTFATLQLAAGTNPKIVSEVLGHKDVAITLDRYSHAMPTMQVEAMGLLDAILGRSTLDAPEVGEDEAPAPNLWLDEPPASPDRPRIRHKGSLKGSYKGSYAQNPGTERPDLSSDRAESDEFGTAYRIPSETSHASQPRSPSTSMRRMRHMRQDP